MLHSLFTRPLLSDQQTSEVSEDFGSLVIGLKDYRPAPEASVVSRLTSYCACLSGNGRTWRKFTTSQIGSGPPACPFRLVAGMPAPLIPEWTRQYRSSGRRPPR